MHYVSLIEPSHDDDVKDGVLWQQSGTTRTLRNFAHQDSRPTKMAVNMEKGESSHDALQCELDEAASNMADLSEAP